MTVAGLSVAAVVPGLCLALVLIRWERRRGREAVADAIHEINRPLSAIRLGLVCAARNGSGSRGSGGAPDGGVAALDGEVERASASVRELARRFGIDVPRRSEQFSACTLAEELVHVWRPAVEGVGRQIELHADPECPDVCGDRGELGQVAANLIANGLEHGEGKIRIAVAAPDGTPVLTVEDEGRYFDDTQVSRRRRFEGGSMRGRGLRIAARAAARNGGRLVSDQRHCHLAAIEMRPAELSS